MGTTVPNHKRLMEELVEGRKTAAELRILLHKPSGDRGPASAEELLMKIVATFEQSLSVLTGSDHGHDDLQSGASGEVYQIKPEPSQAEHSHCGDRSSEDSGESRKRQAFKDRRGCYKRRKTSQSWIVDLPKIEDGQAWRKYGQKEILNAPYPRAYFRCTRKFDQGCKATKQVQQIQDSPKMYRTTYIGRHTCTNMIKASPMIIGSDLFESRTISSESGTPNNHQNHHIIGSSTALIVKQEEYKEGTPTPTPSDLTDNISSLENNNNNLWSDLNHQFQLYEPPMCVSSKMGSDNEDVVSNMYLTDMDYVVKSIDFDSFQFDEADFPMMNSLK